MSAAADRLPAVVRRALAACGSTSEACTDVTTHLDRAGVRLVSIYLLQGGLLRCPAVRGYGQLYDGIPPGTGVIGLALQTCQVQHVRGTDQDGHYRPAADGVREELALPLVGAAGAMGVLNVESTRPMSESVVRMLTEVAAALAARLEELGGPPPESRAQRLVRLATALSEAADLDALCVELLSGACALSGLSSALLVSSRAPTVLAAQGPLAEDLRGLSPRELASLLPWVSDGTSSRTSGERGAQGSLAQQALAGAGVQSFALVPLLSRDQVLGLLLVADGARQDVTPAVVETLELLAALAAADLRTLQATRTLEQQARSDPLTGLPHKGSFDEALRTSLLVPSPAAGPRPAVVLLDLDEFKLVNDRYGHAQGDQVLRRTSRVLAGALRTRDVLYRVGGDEFAVLLRVQDEAELDAVLDRLVWAARRAGHTISAGAAVATAADDPAALLARADVALYRAKAGGRDCAFLTA